MSNKPDLFSDLSKELTTVETQSSSKPNTPAPTSDYKKYEHKNPPSGSGAGSPSSPPPGSVGSTLDYDDDDGFGLSKSSDQYKKIRYNVTDYNDGTAGSAYLGEDVAEGGARAYDAMESSLGTITTMATEASANDALARHYENIDKSNVDEILNQSIGGKVDRNDIFDATAIENFVQDSNTTVTYNDKGDNIEAHFGNELQYKGKPDEKSLMQQIIDGDDIELFNSDTHTSEKFNTKELRVMGRHGDKDKTQNNISLKKYAQNLSKAAKEKGLDENQVEADFEKNFNRLALMRRQERVDTNSKAGRAKTYIDNYYGALINVDIDKKAIADLIGRSERQSNYQNIKLNIGGGVDLDGTNGRIETLEDDKVGEVSFRSRDAVRTDPNSSTSETMSHAAHTYAARGDSELESHRVRLTRELSQYTEYLSRQMTKEQAQRFQNMLDRCPRLQAEQKIRDFFNKNNIPIDSDTESIIRSYGDAADTLLGIENAEKSRDRQRQAISRILDRPTEGSDTKEGQRKVQEAASNTAEGVKTSWHAILGSSEMIARMVGAKGLADVLNNLRMAPGGYLEERRKKRQQEKANKRAARRAKKGLNGVAARKTSIVPRKLANAFSKASEIFNKFRVIKNFKKAIKRRIMLFCAICIIAIQVFTGIMTVLATVTHVTPSFLFGDDTGEFTNMGKQLVKQIDRMAEEDKEQLIARAIAEAERMVREDGVEGSLTRDMIRIEYMDMTGKRLLTTIPNSVDADGKVTYIQRSKYYADDPIPIHYKNIKQILTAVDICLTGYYDHDYKESEGIQFCKEVYWATHTGNFVINTHSYTDSEGNIHYVIDNADLTYMVNLSACDKYKPSDKEVKNIAGPIQVVNDSPRNTDKVNFKSTDVLDIYQNIISMNWYELYELEGYDFYDVYGKYVPDKLIDYADIIYAGIMTLGGVDAYIDPALLTDIGQLHYPVAAKVQINSCRGRRKHPVTGEPNKPHQGADLFARMGDHILAAADGKVTYAGWSNGYGYLVKIKHDNGLETRYGHNSKLLVTNGMLVKRGETIAYAGSTGRSTGPHCHFEVLINGINYDPEPFIGLKNDLVGTKFHLAPGEHD